MTDAVLDVPTTLERSLTDINSIKSLEKIMKYAFFLTQIAEVAIDHMLEVRLPKR